jgi:hypothetical protein
MAAPEDLDHTPGWLAKELKYVNTASPNGLLKAAQPSSRRTPISAIRGDQEGKMHSPITCRMVVLTLALAVASLTQPAPSYAQTQGSDRRQDRRDDRGDARDTKQTGREDARDAKAECKAGDEKSRAECRQEKRDIKQDSRDSARDIKKQ